MKILVTGGSGFIGSHLVEALVKEDCDVRCLVRKTSDVGYLEKLDAEIVYGDITDKNSLTAAIKGIDVVYHSAGILGQWGIPDKAYWEIHVKGTEHILQMSLEEGIKKFIHCSSCGVIGPIKDVPADELCPYNPSNIYETTKAQAEKLVIDAYHKYKLPVTVIRPEFVYGPRDMHVLRLFEAIEKGRFVRIGGGASYIHPTFISDLIHGLLLVVGRNEVRSAGEIYHITGERYVTVDKLLSLICGALGRQRPMIRVPYRLGWTAAILLECLGRAIRVKPPLTVSAVKFFNEDRGFTWAKAESDLGYHPTVTLNEGIERTATWYRQNGYL